jgi:hypothetical protein
MTTPSGSKSIESLHVEEISPSDRLRRSFSVTVQALGDSSISFEWGKEKGTDARLSMQCRVLSWSKKIRLVQAGVPISFESLPFKIYLDRGVPRGGHTGGGIRNGDAVRIGYLEHQGDYLFSKFWVIPNAFDAILDGIRHRIYPVISMHVFGLDDSEGFVWSTGDPDLTAKENHRLGFKSSALDVISAAVEIPIPAP